MKMKEINWTNLETFDLEKHPISTPMMKAIATVLTQKGAGTDWRKKQGNGSLESGECASRDI